MTGLWTLIRRNTQLYFKDKGMFFSSLITPVILLVLLVQVLQTIGTKLAIRCDKRLKK